MEILFSFGSVGSGFGVARLEFFLGEGEDIRDGDRYEGGVDIGGWKFYSILAL